MPTRTMAREKALTRPPKHQPFEHPPRRASWPHSAPDRQSQAAAFAVSGLPPPQEQRAPAAHGFHTHALCKRSRRQLFFFKSSLRIQRGWPPERYRVRRRSSTESSIPGLPCRLMHSVTSCLRASSLRMTTGVVICQQHRPRIAIVRSRWFVSSLGNRLADFGRY